MNDLFEFADTLGPAKIVHIADSRPGRQQPLKAIVVIDNVACGPAIGGVRMAPDVSLPECFRLARAMTLKNAAAGLPHGGGKSVVFADPRMAQSDKEDLMRRFALAIGDLAQYIPGPDMGTNERCMAWVHDEIGRAVGLPAVLGGIPLDEIGATGHGLTVAIQSAAPWCGLSLDGARIAVQGFGSVGYHAARLLAKHGTKLVAASDSNGTLVDETGIDVQLLYETKQENGRVDAYAERHGRGRKLDRDAVIDVDCEVWIPAARPDVIDDDNQSRLKTKLIAQGANIPVTASAEQALHERGVLCLPDFIANAGGVICGSVEYHGGSATQAFDTIRDRISANVIEMLERMKHSACPPRAAATELSMSRLELAMALRR